MKAFAALLLFNIYQLIGLIHTGNKHSLKVTHKHTHKIGIKY